ncbi:hypothetical protein T4B_6026 [Trichinella pseudospiralis]|uniref:Uncharacterized protein n=1 Tax=Trichinella pseudospiralis TaxID=6337 RepID=A0A0V1JB34_TRIPS|nr:hypothetical protein T4B_6026 [Trichinella pseudospiralis]KRZ38967.1 hypothetical protein T4C_12310 [Trichinella pseudospiralis]
MPTNMWLQFSSLKRENASGNTLLFSNILLNHRSGDLYLHQRLTNYYLLPYVGMQLFTAARLKQHPEHVFH